MAEDHLYIVVYDICDQKRWRQVYKTVKSFGQWVQLSVFQCVLSKQQLLRMEHALEDCIKKGEDHVLIADLGPSDCVALRFKSLGKSFDTVVRKATII
jgi:CRISPR-associated protein Cas2